MDVINLNGKKPEYFDPNEFFKEPLKPNEKVMTFLIPLIGQRTEDALSTLDKSLYSENYILNIVKNYLVKQNENPPFKYLDVHIFNKREEPKAEEDESFGARSPARRAPAKPPMARHGGGGDGELDFDYVMKHGHIKGIFVI